MTEHDRREVRKQRAILRKNNKKATKTGKKTPAKAKGGMPGSSNGEHTPETIPHLHSSYLDADPLLASTPVSMDKTKTSSSGGKSEASASTPKAIKAPASTAQVGPSALPLARKRSGLRQRNYTVTYYADKAPKFVPTRVSTSRKVERVPLLPGQEGKS